VGYLDYDKTYFLQFLTKSDHEINVQLPYGNRKIAITQSLKFLGLTIHHWTKTCIQ